MLRRQYERKGFPLASHAAGTAGTPNKSAPQAVLSRTQVTLHQCDPPNTSRRLALGACNACLVGGNPRCSILPRVVGKEGCSYRRCKRSCVIQIPPPPRLVMPRLERDAWSVVKHPRQATKEYASPRRPSHTALRIIPY